MNIDQIKKHAHTFVLNRMSYYEQEDIFKCYAVIFILFLLTFFGALAIIPSIISSIKEEKWLVLFVMSFSYSIIPFLLFFKNIPYNIRSQLLCWAVFLCGFIVMTNSPLVSSARLWFLCATVLSCLLIGNTTAFIVFILSFVSLLWAGYTNKFELFFPIETGLTIWIITLSTFVLVNIIVVGSSYLITLGLKKAEDDLKRSEKLRTNFQTIQQIEEIHQIINNVSGEFDVIMKVISDNTDSALLENDKSRLLIYNLTEIQKATQDAKDLSEQMLSIIPKETI